MGPKGAGRDGSLPFDAVPASESPATPRSVTLGDTSADAPKDGVPVGGETLDGRHVVSPEDYEIVREYARGGLGRILEARDTRLDRVVALKELQRDHPIARARFAREVRVTARLQHPNIVPIHEAGHWPSGAAFYAMKLVEGKTLAQAVTDCRSPAERAALLPAVVDVARAIAYAHSQRILHRDLKPANVLVGPFGETVVIDWGLAKELDGGTDDPLHEELGDAADLFATRFGAVVGTPSYMPPEQAAGAPVDERADVYALGALLYYVISGRTPYDDVPQGDVLDRVVDAPPLPLDRLAPDTPPDLLAIVAKAMSRDPGHRYPTAQALLDELER
jgi:eukaryotic-like serine/threonine-protein kinase